MILGATTAASKIWKKQHYQRLLSKLLDNLRNNIDEITQKRFGQPARFVSLTNIKTVKKIGVKGLQLVTASFHTELGNIALSIAIKEFDNTEEATRNTDLTKLCIQRLKSTSFAEKGKINVSIPTVLFQRGKLLVYEGIQGQSFLESKLDYQSKLQLTGSALAKYHSAELKSANPKRYLLLLKKVLQQLPVPKERKVKYFNSAANMLENSVPLINSGTAGFGEFRQSNIIFSEEKDQKGEKFILTWLIDPEYVEMEKNADRMEDIATFFLRQAVKYYSNKGNLEEIRNDLQNFFEGYNSYLNIHGVSMNKIYGNSREESFAFHLGLNALLEALFIFKRDKIEQQELDRISTCLGLTNYCWKNGLQE
jgi:hypothetical protein